MPADRTGGRNVFVEFSTEPGVVKGGLIASLKCTRREFLDMLNILFRAQGGFDVTMCGQTDLIRSSARRLLRGRYILTPRIPGQQIEISSERFYHRTLSLYDTSEEESSFVEEVRARDGRCVISGQVNLEAQYDNWIGFEVAYIFPLAFALSDIFQLHIFNQLVTHNHQPQGIDSTQNGIVLRTDLAVHWDNYSFAINPNNGYRIQAFRLNCWPLHGKVLHSVCRRPNDSSAVMDALLTWHYEQAVLCNMRGAGEPIFDFDCPPGCSDMMGGDAERMELGFFTQLYGFH